MRFRSTPIWFLLIGASLITNAVPSAEVRADKGSDKTALSIEKVEVGLDGVFKIGRWTPLTVTYKLFERLEPKLEVSVVDPDGCVTTYSDGRAAVDAGRLRTFFRLGRLDGKISYRIVDEDRPLGDKTYKVVSTQTRLRQSDSIWGLVGNGKTLKAEVEKEIARKSARRYAALGNLEIVNFPTVAELPIDLRGYDNFNAIVLLGHFELDDLRSKTLKQWVWQGGHLVLAIGSHSEAFQKSGLQRNVETNTGWLPVQVNNQSIKFSDTQLSGFETYIASNHKILSSQRTDGTRLDLVGGEQVWVEYLSNPLLIRRACGFGRVTILAVDLDRGPLANWKDYGPFCLKLIGEIHGSRASDAAKSSSRRLGQSGISELATQIHAVQDQFDGSQQYSNWTVMGLILAYLLLIGPFDYFLIHRWLKAPRAAWISFPAMVGMATGLTIWAATPDDAEDVVHANQLTIVDVDQETSLIQTQSWMTPQSPATQRYRVEMVASPLGNPLATEQRSPRVLWSGIPEESFGGMYRSVGLELGGRSGYRNNADGTAILNFPMSVLSTRALTASWQYQLKEPLIESDWKATGSSQLLGWFRHRLPVPIEEWVLAYNHQVYYSDSTQRDQLAPLLKQDMSSFIRSRNLKRHLTRTKKTKVQREDGTGDEIMIEQARYNVLNRDPHGVIQMLTFHEAAGGRDYTGLRNSALERLDFSRLLSLDRVVLFGKIDTKVAELEMDGRQVVSDQAHTYIRIVMPVKSTGGNRGELPDLKKKN